MVFLLIKSMWIRKGKGPSGVIGNTQNPQVMATWVYSLNAQVCLTSALQNMGGKEESIQVSHKEEIHGRIKGDSADRDTLRKTLSKCIDPMNPESHPNGELYNIQTGQLAHPMLTWIALLTLERCKWSNLNYHGQMDSTIQYHRT